MFEYTSKKGTKFRIDALSDEDNVTIQIEVDVENFSPKEGGGKGRGKPLGTFRKEWKVHGYYSSFKGALGCLVDKLLAEGENVDDLKVILHEIKTVLVPLARIDQKKQWEQIKELVNGRKEENEKIRNGEEIINADGSPKKRRGRKPNSMAFKVKK